MTAIIRTAFRVNVVKKFIEAFTDSTKNTLYMGIGRPYAWYHQNGSDIEDVSGSGVSPKLPQNNLIGDNEDWEDLMTLKRITISEMSHGIKNVKWEANSYYDAYRSDWNGTIPKARASVDGNQPGDKPLDISESDYYVITDDTDVWICISNGKATTESPPNRSTQSPLDGTNVVAPTTYSAASRMVRCNDGYVWKKVATLDNSTVIKFATEEYFPVFTATSAGVQQDLQTDAGSYKGGIYNIMVETGLGGVTTYAAGSYYIQNANAGTVDSGGTGDSILKIKGNGTGLTFVVNLVENGGTRKVNSIEVVNPGSGYTFARAEIGTGGTVSPSLNFTFTPMRGLGVDPVLDLSAFNLITFAKWASDGGTGGANIAQREITVSNDYRKVSLIMNPKLTGGALADSTYSDLMYYAVGTNNFQSDDIFYYTDAGKTVRGRVIDSDGSVFRFIKTKTENTATNLISTPATNPELAFAAGGATYTGEATVASGRSGTVTTLTPPEVSLGSGEIIYTNYRSIAIPRTGGLTEDIKVVVEF